MIGHWFYMHLALNEFIPYNPLVINIEVCMWCTQQCEFVFFKIVHIIRVCKFRWPCYADGLGWWS